MTFKKIIIFTVVVMFLYAMNLFVIFDETYATVFQENGKVDTSAIKKSYIQATKLGDVNSMDKFTDNLIDLYINQNAVIEEAIGSIYLYSLLLFVTSAFYLLVLVYIEWKLKRKGT